MEELRFELILEEDIWLSNVLDYQDWEGQPGKEEDTCLCNSEEEIRRATGLHVIY